MIRYQLQCENSHEFETWFRSSADFDKQSAAGLLSCPACGSHEVTKALMAPSVSTARKKAARDVESRHADRAREIQGKLREMRELVTQNSENVGDRFARVARDMHHGEEPERGIYGKAEGHEIKDLIEDGIDVMPLPELPEDKN